MSTLDVHFSSAKTGHQAQDEWATPQALFDELNAEFAFTLDPCASRENAKCEKFFTRDMDGLARYWTGERAFVNPPYSKLREWVKKSSEESASGALVVMLIPARTDTRAFHEFIWDAAAHRPRHNVEVRFIKGRLKFGDGKNSAPFPSMIVIFQPKPIQAEMV